MNAALAIVLALASTGGPAASTGGAAASTGGAAASTGGAAAHLDLPREVQRGDQICIQRLDEDLDLVERCPDGRRYEVLPAHLARRLGPPEPPPEPIPQGGGLPYGLAGLWELDLGIGWQNFRVGDSRRSYTLSDATLRLGAFPAAGWRAAATLGFGYVAQTWSRPRVQFTAGIEVLRLIGGPAPVGAPRPFVGVLSGIGLGRYDTVPGAGMLGGLRVPVAPGWGVEARVQAVRRFSESAGWELSASASLFLFLPTAGSGS